MKERLLENWLNNVSELGFQLPFCHSLQAEGHNVVHISRHCQMEMGKDVLSIDSEGVPHAFQLKNLGGGRLSNDRWRKEILPQLDQLVLLAIDHPSIPKAVPHRSFLVLNGELDEAVCVAVEQYNQNLLKIGRQSKLEVLVRGDLYNKFSKLQTDFWPIQLSAHRDLLEMYLLGGDEQLPKDKLSELIEGILDAENPGSKAATVRRVSSCAIFCSNAISQFTKMNNHVAEFEAWIMQSAYVLYFAEKHSIDEKIWRRQFDLSYRSSLRALRRLLDELRERRHLIEGDATVDGPVYGFRSTYLLGLLSALWFFLKDSEPSEEFADEDVKFIEEFVDANCEKATFWGEFCIPQLLARFFLAEKRGQSETDGWVLNLIDGLLTNHENKLLPVPYYGVDDFWTEVIHRFETGATRHSFHEGSFTLESLIGLCATRNSKEEVNAYWPKLTKIMLRKFEPENSVDYYRFRTPSGRESTFYLPTTQSWNDLVHRATNASGEGVPKLLHELDASFYLFLLLVYPHRLNYEGTLWLAKRLLA